MESKEKNEFRESGFRVKDGLKNNGFKKKLELVEKVEILEFL